MASKSRFRITIRVDGIPRRVLSIAERPEGDAVLISKSGHAYHSFPEDPQRLAYLHGVPIREERYSVHPSPASSTGVCTIKHHIRFENGEYLTQVHYTKAPRSQDRAAILFSRRFPHLGLERYAASDHPKNIHIGSYDPSCRTMFATFLVCARGTKFLSGPGTDFEALQFPVGAFDICVLWSFIGFPSSATGGVFHNNMNVPKDLDADLKRQLEEGYTAPQAIVYFRHIRQVARDRLVGWLQQTGSPIAQFGHPIWTQAGFFRSGHDGTPEEIEWVIRFLQWEVQELNSDGPTAMPPKQDK